MSKFEYKYDINMDTIDISFDPLVTATSINTVLPGAVGAAGSTDTIDISPYVFSSNPTYTISAGGSNGYNYTSTGIGINSFNGIEVKDGADIKIGERSLSEFMDRVESRLAILQPKTELLEKFEALQQAYEQYKLLEALCMGDIPKAPGRD